MRSTTCNSCGPSLRELVERGAASAEEEVLEAEAEDPVGADGVDIE